MFRPERYHRDEPELVEAKQAAAEMLYGPVRRLAGSDREPDKLSAGVAAWSLVHGLATLWLNRNLPPQLGEDPECVARSVASYLFQPLP